eukprot:1086492-Rhodomonas_salina.4
MSGTDIAHADGDDQARGSGITLCLCYALSGTKLGIIICVRYEKSGTNLSAVQYQESVAPTSLPRANLLPTPPYSTKATAGSYLPPSC